MNFDENNFLDECRFAKVVNTHNGPALLIAGQVIEVRGEMAAFAELIATALRGPVAPESAKEKLELPPLPTSLVREAARAEAAR